MIDRAFAVFLIVAVITVGVVLALTVWSVSNPCTWITVVEGSTITQECRR